MACLICSRKDTVPSSLSFDICRHCLELFFRKCDSCKSVRPVNKFLQDRRASSNSGALLRYIFEKTGYENICNDCSDDMFLKLEDSGVKVCTICGEVHTFISDRVEGICEACHSNMAKCSVCGEYNTRHDNINIEDGSVICRDCYDSAEVNCIGCRECGILHLINDSEKYDTIYYLCYKCKENNRRICGICGITIRGSSYTEWEGKVVCSSCSETTCSSCGNIAIRPYYLDDRTYCSTCAGINGRAVKQQWDYVPTTLFFHDSDDGDDLYLGFENEQILGDVTGIASRVDLSLVLSQYSEKDMYAVFDGSIGGADNYHGSNGYEIVSHPRTLSSHIEKDWSNLFTGKQIVHNTCGMHIHMSRNRFTRAHLLRLMRLVYLNSAFIEIISEREPNEYARVVSRSELREDAKVMYKRKNRINRRVQVNLCNKHTVELRFFANVINAESLYKNLEFAHALYYYTKDVLVQCVGDFISYVYLNSKRYPNLVAFIEKLKKSGVNLCA